MKKITSRLAVILALVISATLIVPIAACKSTESIIKVTSMGGIPLSDIQVTVLKDGKDYLTGVTGKNGELADEEGNTYSVKFGKGDYTAKINGGLPVGYKADDSYTLDTSKEVISLGVKSEVISEPTPANKNYLIGDIMYDFTLDRAFSYSYNEGKSATSVTLSQILKEKKAVMLNFFYTTCYWCEEEYPSMAQAYNEYSDKIEILGIDNYPQDNETLILNKVLGSRVPFYMAMDTPGVIGHFDISGYPTSVMIDRYGVVCEFIGATTEIETWRNLFAKYTSDDYSQDINIGNDVGDETIFVPDNPADFDVHMPASSEINKKINNTGVNISFTTDEAESAWPWDFADDGQSIYPTNSTHRGTQGIIYASLNIPANTVLAFDYRVSSAEDEDVFYVAVDGRSGIGKQIMQDSGDKAWKTGYAYVSIEAGMHEVAFVYYRSSTNGAHDDKVYIKNIRFENVNSLSGTSLDIPYFAARDNDPETGGFKTYADVYLASDGFYHVSGQAQGGADPILFADIHHATPYFTDPRASIYNNYIATNKCYFGNKNYYSLLNSYNIYAANSDIAGLVPVTDELQKALAALYNSENQSGQAHYSAKGWLEFCVFYKHYGTGEGYGNTIKGLAYFTAFEAKATTGQPDDGNLNEVTVDKLLMPRGFLYKFVPSESGVYKIKGLSKEGTDGWLFDDSLNVASSLHPSINFSGYDDFVRDKPDEVYDPDVADYFDFEMYNYLESGRTYYIQVAFHNTDSLGNFKFRIDYIGEDYYYLKSATAGYYQLNEEGKIVLPVYADAEYRQGEDKFYDKASERPIYCDFTSVSRMFFPYSIQTILNSTKESFKNYFNLTGVSVTIDGETVLGRDYTDDMKAYLAKAKANTGELYGLVEVDWNLQVILRLTFEKYAGTDDDNEWLKACWYYVHVCA